MRENERKVFGVSEVIPASMAVVAEGKFVFLSGQGPGDSELDKGIKDQTRATMDRIKSALEKSGSSMENIVKATIYLKNMSHYSAMNEVYGRYFPEEPPARTCIQIDRMPASEKQLIEIEAIALARRPFQ